MKDFTYTKTLENNINISSINAIYLSINDLDKDFSVFNTLYNNTRIKIYCLDYESILFIDNNFSKIEPKRIIYLIDDSKRINRSYIDLTKIKNIEVYVPLDYLVWGLNFNNEVHTYCFKFKNNNNDFIYNNAINGNSSISIYALERIKQNILLLDKYNVKNVAEKIYLISDFIQSKTQYISGYQTLNYNYDFLKDKDDKFLGYVETVNDKHFGCCMSIANFSTLLLNNPFFNCEVESLQGSNHVWNKVLIDNKYYFFDNTWAITRSDNPSNSALFTKSFQDKYLLFGLNTTLNINFHLPNSTFVYNNAPISKENYKKLTYKPKMEYMQKPLK